MWQYEYEWHPLQVLKHLFKVCLYTVIHEEQSNAILTFPSFGGCLNGLCRYLTKYGKIITIWPF